MSEMSANTVSGRVGSEADATAEPAPCLAEAVSVPMPSPVAATVELALTSALPASTVWGLTPPSSTPLGSPAAAWSSLLPAEPSLPAAFTATPIPKPVLAIPGPALPAGPAVRLALLT